MAGLGPFIPLDTGLSCITKEVPMLIQGSFFSAAFFHIMVNDKSGWIGIIFRTIIGDLDERNVRAIIASFWIITSVGQVKCVS